MCFLSHALPRQVLDFPPNAKEVVSKAFWISPGMKWDKTFYRPSDFTKVPTHSVSAQPCFLRIFSFPLNLHICLSDNCCKMDMTLIFFQSPWRVVSRFNFSFCFFFVSFPLSWHIRSFRYGTTMDNMSALPWMQWFFRSCPKIWRASGTFGQSGPSSMVISKP